MRNIFFSKKNCFYLLYNMFFLKNINNSNKMFIKNNNILYKKIFYYNIKNTYYQIVYMLRLIEEILIGTDKKIIIVCSKKSIITKFKKKYAYKLKNIQLVTHLQFFVLLKSEKKLNIGLIIFLTKILYFEYNYFLKKIPTLNINLTLNNISQYTVFLNIQEFLFVFFLIKYLSCFKVKK